MEAKDWRLVKTDDIIIQEKPSNDYADVFVCALANEEAFVLAKPKIKVLPDGGAEIIGYSKENCKIYSNDFKTMEKNHFDFAE